MSQENNYSVYVVHVNNSENVTEAQMRKQVVELYGGKVRDVFLFVNKGKSFFTVCMKKNVYQTLLDEGKIGKDKSVNITRFDKRNNNMNQGLTYGFYVKGGQNVLDSLRQLFSDLEGKGFLRPGSYSFETPQEFGSSRNYFVVTFTKNENGRFSKKFITSLKFLLDGSSVDGNLISLNWVAASVLSDILKKKQKEVK